MFSFFSEQELLSAAAWYQEGLPRPICEEYLMSNDQPTGAFMIRRSYAEHRSPFVLSMKTSERSVDHFPIDKCLGYRLRVSSRCWSLLRSDHDCFYLGCIESIRQSQLIGYSSYRDVGNSSCAIGAATEPPHYVWYDAFSTILVFVCTVSLTNTTASIYLVFMFCCLRVQSLVEKEREDNEQIKRKKSESFTCSPGTTHAVLVMTR